MLRLMAKAKYPNHLKAIMQRAGMSVQALADAVGTAKQNVSRHRAGERELTVDWANRYAPPLGARPEDLLIFPPKDELATAPAKGKTLAVPLLSWVSAGRLSENAGVTRANVRKTLLAAGLPKGDWIALEVEGDSMDRIAPPGSIIFVDRSDDRLVAGRYYVFATESGDATFKQYRSKPDRLQPYSTNPDHETIHPRTELVVIGRVRRVVNDL